MPIRLQRRNSRYRPIHFKEESIALCHPEQSEGSLAGHRSFAEFTLSEAHGLRMTRLNRLRLTRNSSYLIRARKCW
jgi:hypothetical protein